MTKTTEERRGLDLSALPDDERGILNRVMWLEDRVADLETALRAILDYHADDGLTNEQVLDYIEDAAQRGLKGNHAGN